MSRRNVISRQRTRGALRAALVAFAVLSAHAGRALAEGPTVAPEYTPAAPDAVAPAVVAAEPAPSAGNAVAPRIVAFVAGGLAVVGVGVGTTFGILALDSKSSFEGHPTVARADTGNQEAVLADVAFGTAVIAGVTSLVLLLKSDPPTTHPPATPGGPPVTASFAVSPVASPHGGGAGVVLRF